MMKKRAPQAIVIGIDPDEQALAIARKKAERRELKIAYIKASAAQLPFPDQTFDLVTSTLVFHHLPGEMKVAVLREIRRVLKSGGHFALADFGAPIHPWFSPLPWLGAIVEEGKENYEGKLLTMVRDAGFANVRILARPRANIDMIVSTA
jgi:ubiquinone/menaquinone biosynthesis C-methylase UbiE